MKEMMRLATFKNVKLDLELFRKYLEEVELFQGVETWFGRIDEFVASISADEPIIVEHYIILAGLREMIEGFSIYSYA